MHWKAISVYIVLILFALGNAQVFSQGSHSPYLPQYAPAQLALPIPAKSPQLPFSSPFPIHSLTVNEGLNSAHITALLQDRKGNIWIGYQRMGISKYDGIQFTHFSDTEGLTHAPVSTLIEDDLGNIWIGTDGEGVFRYDGIGFSQWTMDQGLTSNDIRALLQTQEGEIWLGTGDAGIMKFTGETFHPLDGTSRLPSPRIRAMTTNSNGHLYIGTRGGGVCFLDGSDFSCLETTSGLPETQIKSLFQDSKGNLWIGGYSKGVTRFDGNHFITYDSANGLCGNRIVSITEDQDGHLWFGTYANGVCKFDGANFETINVKNGLNHNHVSALLTDRSGNLWMGTAGGGLHRYKPHTFRYHDLANDSSKPKVKALTEDAWGNLWIGTSRQGLIRFDGQTYTRFTTREGLTSDHIGALHCDQKGNLWIGTIKGGINQAILSPTGIQRVIPYSVESHGLSSPTILRIFEDRHHQLWFGTAKGGLMHFDGTTFTPLSTAQPDQSFSVLSLMEDPNGELWVGTDGLGLFQPEEQALRPLRSDPQLANQTLVCMAQSPDGTCWIGTDGGGLYSTSPDSPDQFTRQSGLNSDFIASLQVDDQGRVWVGTAKGLNVLEPEGNGYMVRATYRKPDGNKAEDNFRNCMWLDQQDQLWWGGVDGLIQLDLNAYSPPASIPSVRLEHLEINQQFIDFHRLQNPEYQQELPFGATLATTFESVDPFENFPQNPVFPYDLNHLTFHFSALDWQAPHKIRYSYQLQGLETMFSPIQTEPRADYRNIPPGTYTFVLKARGESGKWSSPFRYAFKIRPPWWQTGWAMAAYGLGLITLIGLVFKWRVTRLKQRQKQLENTVVERTAEVVAQKEVILKEKEHSDKILQNILPEETAEELKQHGFVKAKTYDSVSVLFTDFKGFTKVSERLTSEELVAEIHYCYKAFDIITERLGVEKIKTIGDAYMAAGGLPSKDPKHPINTVKAALAIRDFMEVYQKRRKAEGREPFEIRIGIHTGPVVAGIVGIKKFAYDIWGDTVNTAARMESSGSVGQVNISGATYALVKEYFQCEYRGKIPAKNKGELDMYFVNQLPTK